MKYLIEDPTYLLAGLGLVAVVLLVALRVTQQGKFLIGAGVVMALAAAVFGLERYWVTDAERIEAVVYDLGAAVEASDVDRIKTHLDDQVTFGTGGRSIDGSIPMQIVFPLLKRAHFDFVRIARLETSAMEQARRGSAEFSLTATGFFEEGGGHTPMGSMGTEWSLGFREASPGVWKVNRITAIKLPRDVSRYLMPGR